jgi:hypothetical protein
MQVAPKYQALLDANIAKSDVPSGIAPAAESGLLIYPNPANDQITLNFGLPIGKAEISVFDIQGRLMISKSVASKVIVNIDLDKLGSGIYIIRVASENHLMNSKFMKK